MTCFSPLTAYRRSGGEIVFSEKAAGRQLDRELLIPCGHCHGCLQERAKQWATRCMHEAQMHERNSFITLTYRTEELVRLPHGCCLDYRDFQLFMRRVRKRHAGVSFYMCGEYGEQYSRPHFHACMFGLDFDDRVLFRTTESGAKLFTSKALEELWPHGHSSVGDLTWESAGYVARYCTTKVTGPAAAEHYRRVSPLTGEVFDLVPEFSRMSLNPAIGKRWFERYYADVYPHDYVVVNGMKQKPPRAYDKWLTVLDPEKFEFIELGRSGRARDRLGDSTPDRLRVRESVSRARSRNLVRNKLE